MGLVFFSAISFFVCIVYSSNIDRENERAPCAANIEAVDDDDPYLNLNVYKKNSLHNALSFISSFNILSARYSIFFGFVLQSFFSPFYFCFVSFRFIHFSSSLRATVKCFKVYLLVGAFRIFSRFLFYCTLSAL